MTTGNTTLLGLALPVNGELDGTWGDVVNNSITSLLDSAVAGTTTLSADADVTLTTTTLSANQARQAILLWTASNGATTRNITAPAQSKPYIVINAGTGSVVLRGVGPTTGVTIISGEKCLAAWNGSDFVKVASTVVPATSITGTLAVANGGTGTATPSLVQGANVTISGTWPNQTIAAAAPGVGTVTSVGGTGTVNGISLSGTVTSSGNLTLGGALSGVSLATQVTGTLPVANGGTGATALTANNVILGNGTSAVQVVAPGTVGNVLTSDGTTWASAAAPSSSIIRVARTSNTALAAANKGNLIDITSGTFTQTFDACSSLGNGWFAYIDNSGTGDITLDPDGSETIDGLTSYIMYPGEVRLVQCDGTALRTIVLNTFARTFTASGTFTKPPGYAAFEGLLWGGGGSGAKTSAGGGGGGGACVPFNLSTAVVGSSVTVTIAATATGPSASNTAGVQGNNSTFGSLVTAFGGAGGDLTTSGGGGGGALSAGGVGANPRSGGSPNVPVNADSSNPGFGGGNASIGGVAGYSSAYGGGGGGLATTAGGASLYGGGGGGGSSAGAGGSSTFGGSGGAGVAATSGVNGVTPAGGGGATGTGTKAGDGARGELRIGGII